MKKVETILKVVVAIFVGISILAISLDLFVNGAKML